MLLCDSVYTNKLNRIEIESGNERPLEYYNQISIVQRACVLVHK